MRTASYLIILLLNTCFSVQAQTLLEGKTISAINHKPVPFVNVGIVSADVGTVSGQDGCFALNIDKKYRDDSILFSCVGYATRKLAIVDLIDRENIIVLDEKVHMLPEVEISGKLMKDKLLGNKIKSSKLFRGGFGSNALGAEMGIKLQIKDKPTLIEEVRIGIVENTFDSVTLRVNLYAIENGMPSQRINWDNYKITTSLKNGIETIDLRPYNIVVEEDVIITIEWIEKFGPQEKGVVLFPMGLFTSKTFYRKTSQSDWKSVKVLGARIEVLVLH